MKPFKILFTFAVAFVMLTGIASCDRLFDEPQFVVSPATPADIVGTMWKFAGFVDAETGDVTTVQYGHSSSIPDPDPLNSITCYRLTFVSDSTALGRSEANGINLDFGQPLLPSVPNITALQHKPSLLMTLVGESDEANRYTGTLGQLTAYQCDGGILKLYYNSNKEYLLYQYVGNENPNNQWLRQSSIYATDRVQGVYFGYHLLNSSGEATNRFSYGEIFSFRFFMNNDLGPDNLYYEHNVVCEIAPHGFGTVFSSTGEQLTQLHVICDEMLQYKLLYQNSNEYQAVLPVDYDATGQPYQPLPKGQYYTELKHTFKFQIGNSLRPVRTLAIPVNLKVHFVIE
jgi:hypothetical protein